MAKIITERLNSIYKWNRNKYIKQLSQIDWWWDISLEQFKGLYWALNNGKISLIKKKFSEIKLIKKEAKGKNLRKITECPWGETKNHLRLKYIATKLLDNPFVEERINKTSYIGDVFTKNILIECGYTKPDKIFECLPFFKEVWILDYESIKSNQIWIFIKNKGFKSYYSSRKKEIEEEIKNQMLKEFDEKW